MERRLAVVRIHVVAGATTHAMLLTPLCAFPVAVAEHMRLRYSEDMLDCCTPLEVRTRFAVDAPAVCACNGLTVVRRERGLRGSGAL